MCIHVNVRLFLDPTAHQRGSFKEIEDQSEIFVTVQCQRLYYIFENENEMNLALK